MAWLYSLTRDGKILVREGYVIGRKSSGQLATFHVYKPGARGGATQRILVPKRAGVIRNDMMWSESNDRLTLYYTRMNVILIDRENAARDRLGTAISRRHTMNLWYNHLKGGGTDA